MKLPGEFDKIFVLDTNIILDDANNISELSENGKNLIILPETVLDELDSFKSGLEEKNFQARNFARMLYDAKVLSKEVVNDLNIIEIFVNSNMNANMLIISKNKYDAEKNNNMTSIVNDRKILEITKNIQGIPGLEKLKFISLDVMARTRAISLDIITEPLNFGNKDTEYEFVKTLEVKEFPKESDNILNVDINYNCTNFSYIFDNGYYSKIAYVKNNNIYYIDEKELARQEVTPLNIEQKLFSNAMLDDFYNIVVADAKAGSGKTLLAVSAAMKKIREKNNEIHRVVYIRNSIESLQKGEDVGYLSGNEEKFEIYNYPLFDTLAYIATKQLEHSKANKSKATQENITEELITEKVRDLVERYQIETMWVGGMRGRTLSNAFIIVDEAQNMSAATLQLVLSRVDKTCKIVVIGSNKQIDNQYVSRYTNGLTILLNSTKDNHEEVNLFSIKLEKVLRGPITAFAEKIFGKS